MKKYKQLIKCLMMAVLAVPALSSCSDWTDTESLEFDYVLPSEQDPDAYNAYLGLLREYKQSQHKIMIAKFDNSGDLVSGQSDRLAALPDSIDYVVLQEADNLKSLLVQDMNDIRQQKGTRTLYAISYADALAKYQAILDEEGAAAQDPEAQADGEGEEQPETPAVDRFLEVAAQYVNDRLALYDKYGYDGIVVIYSDPAYPAGLSEEEYAQLQARQEAFFAPIQAWAESHQEAAFIFEGYPQNVIDPAVFTQADYVVVTMLDAVSSDELVWAAEMALTEGVPSDRIVFGVTIPDMTDDKATDGYWGSDYAVVGAAYTVISANGSFTKAGLCVDNVEDDYFNVDYIYPHVREAIQIMN
ncbi:glycoside hydrolase family 18 [Bacteroides sp. ET71]|uniref:glycoside hydrolase family 18 n=1 Tax=Bacteroides sp. ET71 TaxID=2939421 RepID=UPI0020131C25|nr:glycoside hydrolase family 18 [Bacteroides sp. ET71]MCL1616380.1 glycoside hydrolase family 18 [Bacteroides sp. ET71]